MIPKDFKADVQDERSFVKASSFKYQLGPSSWLQLKQYCRRQAAPTYRQASVRSTFQPAVQPASASRPASPCQPFGGVLMQPDTAARLRSISLWMSLSPWQLSSEQIDWRSRQKPETHPLLINYQRISGGPFVHCCISTSNPLISESIRVQVKEEFAFTKTLSSFLA